jgi:hypothetical protein
VACNRDHWLAVMSAMMNDWVPYSAGSCWHLSTSRPQSVSSVAVGKEAGSLSEEAAVAEHFSAVCVQTAPTAGCKQRGWQEHYGAVSCAAVTSDCC